MALEEKHTQAPFMSRPVLGEILLQLLFVQFLFLFCSLHFHHKLNQHISDTEFDRPKPDDSLTIKEHDDYVVETHLR